LSEEYCGDLGAPPPIYSQHRGKERYGGRVHISVKKQEKREKYTGDALKT